MNESTHAVEQWKPIPDYVGYYEVSDLGRVRSVDRIVRDRLGHDRRLRGRIMTLQQRPDGHVRIDLSMGNATKAYLVHVLVLEAFVGSRPLRHEVCHNNGVASDNRLVNLRWDTHAENAADQIRHGTHHEASKTHCPHGHELIKPNIPRWALRQNLRACLSCERSRAARQHAAKRGESFDFIADADARYADLMGSRRAA